jgi:histidinol-phosphate phosphatase family protein
VSGRAAVFFDLHGTLGAPFAELIHQDGHYFPDFCWYPMAAEAIRLVKQAGFLAIAITNQSPIANGRFTLDAFWSRMRELEAELKEKDADLDAVYCCPHGPTDDCDCCKPRTAFVEEACRAFDIDPHASFVVGDRGDLDMLLAAAIGARGVLVRTGQGEGSLGEFRDTWAEVNADHIAADVLDAVRWIVERQKLIRV